MKVYNLPEEVPAPTPDYHNYNFNKEQQREKEHENQLKQYLLNNGYAGALTGEIYQEPMGDGYALYMYGDAGAKSILIHLPYGDAWDSQNVSFIPRKEIIKRITARKSFSAIFPSREQILGI